MSVGTLLLICGISVTAANLLSAVTNTEETVIARQTGTMRTKEGEVRFQKGAEAETVAAVPQPMSFGDALHTLELSRASGVFSDWTQFRLKPRSVLKIEERAGTTNLPAIELVQGGIYISSRGAAQTIPIYTPHVKGTPRGTEFSVSVESDQTVVTMYDGDVLLDDGTSRATVRSGEQGTARPGAGISVRPVLAATNVVQWWIYYPGVLDPAELAIPAGEQGGIATALRAYRDGDLPAALKAFPDYPNPAAPASEDGRVFLAGLLLSVGAVEQAELQLPSAASNNMKALALRNMIAAVQGHHEAAAGPGGRSASYQLAISYVRQATNGLQEALTAARQAVRLSPEFGFGWARVAELEFSFGHTRAAHDAVERALMVSPRNAQAHALKGFLLAAENKTKRALECFESAVEIDPALGNAWLGLGLCKKRLGIFGSMESKRPDDSFSEIPGLPGTAAPASQPSPSTHLGQQEILHQTPDWLADIQTAAIMEPNRSLARSYAGKAFSEFGDARLSRKELAYAKKLDPNDPTPWLYEALENFQENRANRAVEDLEKSIALNENRTLYRSRLLLDQDRAVRSASLAKIYLDAGLNDFSVNEAARAVSSDYTSHSAHQFLAESYDALRDPTRFNLRYETVWFNELLLANVLAPVGAGLLSQNISEQEYSRLFEADRLGILSSTEYRSDKQLREIASQFGTYGGTSYTLDLDYQHNDGVRPNNDLNRIDWYTQIKQQVSPEDSIFFLTKYQDYESGDNFQYYNPTNARPNYRLSESQEPLFIGAWHREWSPGIHTTAMAGRLENQQTASDRQAPQTLLLRDGTGAIVSQFQHFNFDVNYRSDFVTYIGEINQIIETPWNTLVLGAQVQRGQFDTSSTVFNPQGFANFFMNPPAEESLSQDFNRAAGYAYDTIRFDNTFQFTAGVNYDTMTYPANFRSPPIAPGEAHKDLVSPKLAAIFTPFDGLTLRGAYSKSLGGASFDESFRLEPAQLAGFVQSFRSLISESIVGIQSAPEIEMRGVGIDWRLPWRTYFNAQAQWLRSEVAGPIGVFYDNFTIGTEPEVFPGELQRSLSYQERSISATLVKLIGDEWSAGIAYRLTASELETAYPQIPVSIEPNAKQAQKAELHQGLGFIQFTAPSGFFARAEADYYNQSNHGYAGTEPGDAFTQVNLYAGWRFARRRAEITFGILNLGGDDYHLNPLTPYSELPRDRVFLTRLRFSF
jgi:tetratricopeptide (TPR) repeat protein